MKLAITTLTCNNRQVLFKTIKQFILNTSLLFTFNWYIFAQGCDTAFVDRIHNITHPNITFHVHTNPENLGLSKGMNRLWDTVKDDYDYVLNIEDDWIASDFVNKNWLNASTRLLNESPDISFVFLRKYLSEKEKWQYGWTRNIPYLCFKHGDSFNYQEKMKTTTPFVYDNLEFQIIPKWLYTFNPVISRVSTLKQRDVFPLHEFNDKHDKMGEWQFTSYEDCPEWGYSEALSMEKVIHDTCVYLLDGIFYHDAHTL
jgi:hypothetical protein